MSTSDPATRPFFLYHHTSLVLAAWIGVILMAGLLPLRNFVGHSHWESIQWTIPASLWH